VQARRAGAHGAGLLEAVDQRVGAPEQVVDEALVVLHGGALRDHDGHRRGARRAQLADPQDALDESGACSRLLPDREALGDHLRAGPRSVDRMRSRNRSRCSGVASWKTAAAERVDEHLAAAVDRVAQLVSRSRPPGMACASSRREKFSTNATASK